MSPADLRAASQHQSWKLYGSGTKERVPRLSVLTGRARSEHWHNLPYPQSLSVSILTQSRCRSSNNNNGGRLAELFLIRRSGSPTASRGANEGAPRAKYLREDGAVNPVAVPGLFLSHGSGTVTTANPRGSARRSSHPTLIWQASAMGSHDALMLWFRCLAHDCRMYCGSSARSTLV
jgi:hypothetical protein